MSYVEVALRGASGTTGTLRGFLPRSLGQRGSGGVWRPAEVVLALGNRRRRAVGPNPCLWRVPGLRNRPRWERGSGVFPCCPSGGRDRGSVRLVEDAGYGRSYPVALADGGILRTHKTAADGP